VFASRGVPARPLGVQRVLLGHRVATAPLPLAHLIRDLIMHDEAFWSRLQSQNEEERTFDGSTGALRLAAVERTVLLQWSSLPRGLLASLGFLEGCAGCGALFGEEHRAARPHSAAPQLRYASPTRGGRGAAVDAVRYRDGREGTALSARRALSSPRPLLAAVPASKRNSRPLGALRLSCRRRAPSGARCWVPRRTA